MKTKGIGKMILTQGLIKGSMMVALAGPVAEDATAWRLELPAPAGKKLSDYRIGLWPDDSDCAVDTGYAEMLRSMADKLAAAGAKTEESHPAVSFHEQADVFHKLYDERGLDRQDALREMTVRYRELMHSNEPVHDWPVS